MCVLDVYVMISMIFLCFKNLGLRNGEHAQALPVARLGSFNNNVSPSKIERKEIQQRYAGTVAC